MKPILFVLLVFITVAACSNTKIIYHENVVEENCTTEECLKARELVEAAKVDIGSKRYIDATNKCTKAEELDDTYDEAKYCMVAANLGSLAQSVSAILGLMASQVAPVEYRASVSAKQLMQSVLTDIEQQMAAIDTYAYKLAAMEDPKFQIQKFPLELDPADVLVFDSGAIDLKGTWRKPELLLLGAVVNAAQALIDYMMSHKLILDNTEIDLGSTENIALFLVNNPDFLVADTDLESTERLLGGPNRKGLKNDVLAALSFLAGRKSALARVSPAHEGLPAAILAAAAKPATDAVVTWYDENSDGYPEKVYIPALANLPLYDDAGLPLFTQGVWLSPFAAETMSALFQLIAASNANIEAGGGAPVSLKNALRLLSRDLAPTSDFRLFMKTFPDALALNPGGFLAAPPAIGAMLPYVYSYQNQVALDVYNTRYDLAWEKESLQPYTTEVSLEKNGHILATHAGDYGHFVYDDLPEYYQSGAVVSEYSFDGYLFLPEAIATDGVKPSVKTPVLMYIAWRDPTFGGLLQGDLNFTSNGSGGNFKPMSTFEINKWANKLLKYYCFDLDSYGDMFSEWDYPYDNQIADCDQPL